MLPAPEGGAKKGRASVDDALSAGERELFLHLKALRTSIAARDSTQPSALFPDKSLREMARLRPCDRESLGKIPGVGMVRLEKYGPDFISLIRCHVRDKGA